jgi:hypothetical protein
LEGDWREGEVEDKMEGEAWVGGSEGFGYTYRDRGVDSPVTVLFATKTEYAHGLK